MLCSKTVFVFHEWQIYVSVDEKGSDKQMLILNTPVTSAAIFYISYSMLLYFIYLISAAIFYISYF